MMMFLISCQVKQEKAGPGKKLIVVTSLFPLYDFARNIGQGRADVSLLLPPGLEAHSFEPKPGDMVRLNQANVFIYTNSAMEPWVQDVLKGVQNRELKIIESGQGIAMISDHDKHGEGEKAGHRHGSDHGGADPHIWLDFSNAEKIVDHILSGFIEKDPLNIGFYQANAGAYKAKLNDLDRQFREGLSGCRKKIIVHGGHSAFGYLAQRYGLKYVAVSGFSPDAEPTPAGMVRISKTLKANGLNHLFYEELLSPRIAESIARETGVSLLMLHGAHNVSKEEFERGVSFLDLMQINLQNLKRGLQCPQP
jgi:zinc transport system substrate-binding protein